jgi:hypothetical protein
MRVQHYSIHAERSSCGWIKRFVLFHGMKTREDLQDGEKNLQKTEFYKNT